VSTKADWKILILVQLPFYQNNPEERLPYQCSINIRVSFSHG